MEHNTLELDHAASVSADSGLGSDTQSNTTSIASSILNYQYENGRRYHAYRQGTYLLPNDEAEQDRMDLHHHIFRLGLDGNLIAAPIPKESLKRVLDFGTGTGIWAIDFADEFPEATVIGTDLSPIQPSWLPPNCSFFVEDVESEWVYSEAEKFDLVHGRGMSGSISDFKLLYQRIFNNLRPGGWIEIQEYEGWIYSEDDPELEKCPNILSWLHLINEGASKFGKGLNLAKEQEQNMKDAGFVDVHDGIVKVPMGPWAKGSKHKEIGRFQREHMIACVEPFTMAIFTRVLGWSLEETQVIMANVRKEMRDPKNHLLTIFHYTYGRKPTEEESA